MKILYAGDSEAGGPANYLLGILKFIRADFIHAPPSKTLAPSLLNRRYDAILLSDFPEARTPAASQKAIARQVAGGTGLLMIGGWASFSGPSGHWRGSLIEKILPVACLARDDRVNFPGGALIACEKKHPMFQSINFKNPPVICGLNRIQPRKNSSVVLSARRIVDGVEFPLLVIDADPKKRIAALATDLAPHWSGGLVDWGSKRVRLPVKNQIWIEIGDSYVRFVSSLLNWLTDGRKKGFDAII